MKNVLLLVLLSLCILSASSCQSRNAPSGTSEPAGDASSPGAVSSGSVSSAGAASSEAGTGAGSSSAGAETVWTEQALATLFEEHKEEGWTRLACAVMPDQAYGQVGAVLFRDGEGSWGVAFLQADGFYLRSGVSGTLAPDPAFTYLGNGQVSFQMEGEDGTPYPMTITLAVEEGDVTFQLEAD